MWKNSGIFYHFYWSGKKVTTEIPEIFIGSDIVFLQYCLQFFDLMMTIEN